MVKIENALNPFASRTAQVALCRVCLLKYLESNPDKTATQAKYDQVDRKYAVPRTKLGCMHCKDTKGKPGVRVCSNCWKTYKHDL